LIYWVIVFIKFPRKYEDLHIPIISIGNIVVGGSGKTPITIEIANKFKKYKPAVVLRGYKRNTKGLLVVKNKEILCDVESSGDEAMEIAKKTDAIVIVSEDRKKGILKAKELGAGFVLLDDGFDKPFRKLNIVIDLKIKNPFLLPAGAYRYPRSFLKYADIVLVENKNFKREVNIPKGDILITAISKPKRLLKWWKGEYKFFPDHFIYSFDDLKSFRDKIIVTTYKDYVKLQKFPLNLNVIDLRVKLNGEIYNQIENYLIKLQQKGSI
jgi:tetraacyldisaccharide 4'-kinase